MKKYIYKYLAVIVVLILLIVFVQCVKNEMLSQTGLYTADNIFTSKGEHLIKQAEEIQVSEKENMDMKFPLNTMYKVGEEKAFLYSASLPDETDNLEVGNKLKFNSYVSDQLYLLFRESYPNISIKDMGLENEEQAYQAVQLAIWEIASRTGEAKYGSELSRIDSVRAQIGEENINHNVFQKAKELVQISEDYSKKSDKEKEDYLTMVPTLVVRTVDVKEKMIDIGDYKIVGPYKYKVESGIITDMDVEIGEGSTQKENIEIVDSKGKKIEDYKDVNEVYVKFADDFSGKIILNFKSKVKRLAPSLYGINNMDYIANAYVINEMEQPITIEINL